MIKNIKYEFSINKFDQIPGSPIAYWISDDFLRVFKNQKLKDISRARRGLETGNNEKFILCWYEINKKDLTINCKQMDDFTNKWLPHNKGGNFRNWYGNRELVVWFKNKGEDIKKSGNLNGYNFYLKEGITWTALTSYKNSFRYTPYGATFDSNKGPLIVESSDGLLYYLLSFFISPVAQKITKLLNPTLSLQNGDIDKIPIKIDYGKKEKIDLISKDNISLSKLDYDSFETSWDFKKHPFI